MVVESLTLMLMSMGSVGLWTLRVTMAAHDRRIVAAAVAAVESIVFAVSFSQLVADLEQIHRLVGYSSGVAIGTYAGMVISRHVPPARPAPRPSRQDCRGPERQPGSGSVDTSRHATAGGRHPAGPAVASMRSRTAS